jgi:predicted esterase
MAFLDPQAPPATRFMRPAIGLVLLVFVILALGGVYLLRSERSGPEDAILAGPAPTELPAAPFNVAVPPDPPVKIHGEDVTKLDPETLVDSAADAAQHGEWERAAAFEHWAVVHGAGSQYDLAGYHSRAGHLDPAIYWLQRAAVEEGVDARSVDDDDDIQPLRADGRWATLRAFLVQATRYWVGQRIEKILVTVPTGYAPGRAIPVVVALHGLGSVPDDFTGHWAQATADELGVAFVSVSGTQSIGPHSFRWAESPDQDLARIDAALAEARDRVTAAERRVVLLGFSQGAQMSAEIAARHPDKFVGAIVMSPGTLSERSLDGIGHSGDLAQYRFVVVAGAGESPRTVARAHADADRLTALGGDVFTRIYPDMNTHAFPPDFERALPRWIGFVLGTEEKPKGQNL